MARWAGAWFDFDVRSWSSKFILWSALGVAATSLPWIDKVARRVDATCAWESTPSGDVPRCLVRTRGLWSSSEAIVYPTSGYSGWFALSEHDWERWTWRSFVLGDRIELADGCTATMLLSDVPSGTRSEVDDAVAQLNLFFREKRPEVRVTYGPWGSPLLFFAPLSLVVGAMIGALVSYRALSAGRSRRRSCRGCSRPGCSGWWCPRRDGGE